MRRITRTAVSAATVLSLVLTSCSDGGGDAAASEPQAVELAGMPEESGMPEDPKPVRGGQLVYGVEADNDNFCLPEAQMAIAGIQIARAIYDPLVVPNAEGGYSPYLAESVEPNADYTEWTIKLRPNITFHNGEKLDATVVMNNLDAYRGKPGSNRASLLLAFAYSDIANVSVVNELTVKVETTRPWVAFDASLYNSGRVLMLAQEQLDADTEACAKRPIGTGPFQLSSWEEGVSMKLQRNENYWLPAPDGEPYPYANAVDFRFLPNDDARIAALQQGDINIMHSSSSADIAKNLAQLRDDGAINLLVSQNRTETTYFMLNAQEGSPFARRDVRVAVAQAIDRERINELGNRNLPSIADGPFAPEVMGYLEENGFPDHDPEAAKAFVQKMKDAGEDTTFRLLSSNNPSTIRASSLAKEMLEEAGFTVELEVELQVDLIRRAIGGEYDMAYFRNQPGDDPDVNYNWWYGGGNPVNFGKFSDDVIDENLDLGRENPDEDVRREAYETVNRRMGEQVYNVYLYYQPWAVAMAPNVHGVFGPTLPNGDDPSARLANGHPVIGLWIESDDQAS